MTKFPANIIHRIGIVTDLQQKEVQDPQYLEGQIPLFNEAGAQYFKKMMEERKLHLIKFFTTAGERHTYGHIVSKNLLGTLASGNSIIGTEVHVFAFAGYSGDTYPFDIAHHQPNPTVYYPPTIHTKR